MCLETSRQYRCLADLDRGSSHPIHWFTLQMPHSWSQSQEVGFQTRSPTQVAGAHIPQGQNYCLQGSRLARNGSWSQKSRSSPGTHLQDVSILTATLNPPHHNFSFGRNHRTTSIVWTFFKNTNRRKKKKLYVNRHTRSKRPGRKNTAKQEITFWVWPGSREAQIKQLITFLPLLFSNKTPILGPASWHVG